MELSDLTAYASEKYNICEEKPFPAYPGLTALASPGSKKWIAFLIREWDPDLGEEIQRCDLKCGEITAVDKTGFLTRPFCMKGRKWTGIIVDEGTDRDTVFRLFDMAVRESGNERAPLGYTFVLEAGSDKKRERPAATEHAEKEQTGSYHDYAEDIPGKILRMQKLYSYGSGSFRFKCMNFYRQGKFMEDYEDDAPWDGKYLRYFPTYHDLNLRQLRGYFTWRTCLRRGEFRHITASLAYIYLYELLCGIGTDSPEDALQKMRAFEKGFLDSGIGDQGMRRNLRRWMLDYCVLHNLPEETARSCADPALLRRDECLAVLRDPGEYSDAEIFDALCSFAEKKLSQSPVIKKDKSEGEHLFASVWRQAAENYTEDGSGLFETLFGRPCVFEWHPLANTIHMEEPAREGTVYTLDACRNYRYSGGVWTEKRYDTLFFDRKKFHGFLRGADTHLRKILRTGHYLKEKEEEDWVKPYVLAALAADAETERKARAAEISIDISHLDQIRRDADITRDSLLTEEESGETSGRPGTEEVKLWRPRAGEGTPEKPLAETGNPGEPWTEEGTLERTGTETGTPWNPRAEEGTPGRPGAETGTPWNPGAETGNPGEPEPEGAVSEKPQAGAGTSEKGPWNEINCSDAEEEEKTEAANLSGTRPEAAELLDPVYVQVLCKLLRGESAGSTLKAAHVLPSVAADQINEALFDEIGDTAVVCEGDTLEIMEDYRGDIAQILDNNKIDVRTV